MLLCFILVKINYWLYGVGQKSKILCAKKLKLLDDFVPGLSTAALPLDHTGGLLIPQLL